MAGGTSLTSYTCASPSPLNGLRSTDKSYLVACFQSQGMFLEPWSLLNWRAGTKSTTPGCLAMAAKLRVSNKTNFYTIKFHWIWIPFLEIALGFNWNTLDFVGFCHIQLGSTLSHWKHIIICLSVLTKIHFRAIYCQEYLDITSREPSKFPFSIFES